jgi:hypothetical protein
VGIIQVLKNLQMELRIVFSTAFANFLDTFINLLEGEQRPTEAVAADFLRDSFELAIRKFFRVVRSVKGSALKNFSFKTPELCPVFLTSLFTKIAADFSVTTTMLALDNYYRFKVSRRNVSVNAAMPAKAEKSQAKKPTVRRYSVNYQIRYYFIRTNTIEILIIVMCQLPLSGGPWIAIDVPIADEFVIH